MKTNYRVSAVAVLIPFIQGGVFRQVWTPMVSVSVSSLNPFHTGRGLSTNPRYYVGAVTLVLIPFIQGGVFRQRLLNRGHREEES